MESRNNKKRSNGRMTKHLADLTLQAGLVSDCLSLYHSAAETLKAVNDWLWLGAAYEGEILTFIHCVSRSYRETWRGDSTQW